MTCDYAWMGDDGPIFCLAPPTFDVRWHWLRPPEGRPEWDGGQMCELHIMLAAEQLAEDTDIEYGSIGLRKKEQQ